MITDQQEFQDAAGEALAALIDGDTHAVTRIIDSMGQSDLCDLAVAAERLAKVARTERDLRTRTPAGRQ